MKKFISKAHVDNMKISTHTRKIQEKIVVEQKELAVEQEKLANRMATFNKRKGNRIRLQEIRENRRSWKSFETAIELMIIIAEELQKLNEKGGK